MATVNLSGFGHLEAEEVTGAKTLDAGDSGVVQNVMASAVITAPASAAGNDGCEWIVRVGKAGITVEIAPNSADKFVGAGLTAADDKSIYFTDQPAGSYIVFGSNAAATTDSALVIKRILGTITREA
jgi:hypothetical protein